MSVLIDADFDANYNEDTKALNELNKHLDITYDENTDKIMFNFDFAKGDHYVTISVDEADLIEAIGKAKKIKNE